MRILGVDPGLRVTGYGVIEVSDQRPLEGRIGLLEAGIVRTQADEGIARRLTKVYTALSEVVEEHRPHILVLEKLYAHYKHPATAILMGHMRGVVCLISGMQKIPLANIASTHVKKAVTGRGHAGKNQIQRMIQHVLSLKELPQPPDVADALAVAIAYVSHVEKKKL